MTFYGAKKKGVKKKKNCKWECGNYGKFLWNLEKLPVEWEYSKCVYTKNTTSQSWGEEAEEKAKQKLTELLQKQEILYAGLL